jgi:flagellar motor switch protein FliM
MGKTLSQAQVDALLWAATAPRAAEPPAVDASSVVPYNFRRPDRVTKEQIHSLQFLHDRFARNVSTSLSAYLRTMTEVSVVSVEQFSYSEFLSLLAGPTAFYALAIPPFQELGALEITPPIAFAMVDRMLGGGGRTTAPNRALTDIEQNVVDSVVKLLLEALTETWRPIVDLAFGIRGRETRPQMLQVAAPNETVLMIVFDIKIGETRGFVNLCLPATIVESTDGHFAQAWHRQKREPTAVERGWVQQNLAKVSVDLSALIEARVATRDLLAMAPGDVVSLGVPVHKPIELRVGTTPKFRGRLGVDEGRIAVRIEQQCTSAAPEA